jgi:hypothetical protein
LPDEVVRLVTHTDDNRVQLKFGDRESATFMARNPEDAKTFQTALASRLRTT